MKLNSQIMHHSTSIKSLIKKPIRLPAETTINTPYIAILYISQTQQLQQKTHRHILIQIQESKRETMSVNECEGKNVYMHIVKLIYNLMVE